MPNIAIVESLIKAINRNDRQQILDHFSADAIFHNIPMHSVQGHEAIWEFLRPLHDITTAINWQIHHIGESHDGLVLTERTDRYQVNGHWAEFQVMGIFEISDGKISHWRDYFDLKKCMATLQGDA